MEEHNYVECNHCGHWDDSQRRNNVCEACNNTRTVIDPKEYICNRCAGPMRPLGSHNEQYPHGLQEVAVSGGYDSYHLFDCTTYHFSLCEKCLRELFNQFKIPPAISDTLGGLTPTAWEEDQEAYEYRVWKDNGGHHQAYLDKKCNFVKDCPNTAIYTQRISGEFTENCTCEEHKELWNYMNAKLVKFIPDVLKPFL